MRTADQINVLDPRALGDLKRQAREGTPEALAAAARQFEALFLQMVLKSMRDATPSNGLTDSDQTRMYQSLLDQQLAQNLTQQKGTGLAQALIRQLGANAAASADALGTTDGILPPLPLPARTAALPASGSVVPPDGRAPGAVSAALESAAEPTGGLPAGAREFVERVWPHAAEASRTTGIPAHFMVAQAALETGWGRSELRQTDGRPSYNLFNIKAGRNWDGATVSTITTEYAGGQAGSETARFRAYGSYAEAFRDYARLLTTSPRYADVLNASDGASFARRLQQSGYATDPMYADKLMRIIGGSTLRSALGS